MGVDLGDMLSRHRFDPMELSGRWVAVDAFNTLYQFLSIIRQQDGCPLMDSSGRVTSHLSGILYRITGIIVAGAKVAFVLDGEPPEFKAETLKVRAEVRSSAEAKWQESEGEERFKYAQASSRLNEEIIEDALRLLDCMGLPIVQAPSEGEAQAACMASRGDVDLVSSQDYDSLLFGAPRVVRNLALTGRRKLPRKKVYVDVNPEVIVLQEVLERLGIDRVQLVEIGIMCGTDYNPGLPRVGPKTALKLIKEHGDLESVLSARGESLENFEEIRDLFLHPPTTDDYSLRMRTPRSDEIVSFLCDERDFSEERVRKVATRLEEAYRVGQSTLDRWL
ncbi:MAG: flap endonuclease-1 [Methanotrichaceae archaeon]|nr:flap endonuclease-1 [Methanotrichaceae archaeon]